MHIKYIHVTSKRENVSVATKITLWEVLMKSNWLVFPFFYCVCVICPWSYDKFFIHSLKTHVLSTNCITDTVWTLTAMRRVVCAKERMKIWRPGRELLDYYGNPGRGKRD